MMNVIVFQHDLRRIVGFFKRKIDSYEEFYEEKDDLNFLGFDAKMAARFIKHEYGDAWSRVYDNCIPWAMKSDIFRVLAVYSLGGCYVDSKFGLKGVPPFIKDEPERFHICEWHDGHIVNGVFYAPKGHPVLGKLVDRIYANLTDPDRPNNVFKVTGPGVWRSLLCDSLSGDEGAYKIKKEFGSQVSVFTKRAFFRRKGMHLGLPNTRGTSQHWSKFQKENSIYRDVAWNK
ncbi:hypothetical protein AVO43_04545 [Microbulbifer sp. ZGT114]|nr:hypothetical protein AVO43_04545 [Microbulbifer sp. ZGT114]